jgi:chemotaxis protein CheX
MMNVNFLNPFIESVFEVLSTEIGATGERGKLELHRDGHTTEEITVLISLVGQISGIVLIGFSKKTALTIVSTILDQSFSEFDELAQSGIGELGNVIVGHAATRLSQAGFHAELSPPTLIQGGGTLISTLDFKRVVVPIKTSVGTIRLDLALRTAED